jgi:hypothetical protein
VPKKKLLDKESKCVGLISDSRRKVGENRVLLGCYAASSDKSLPTFRDKISFSLSRVNNSRFMTL